MVTMRILGIGKKKDKSNDFMSLASARHNSNIERVVYTNSKITKRLFWVGAVLPDFKLSWGVLLVYIVYTYPIGLKTRISNAIKDVITTLKLKISIRGYY